METFVGVGGVEPDVVPHIFTFQHSTEYLALALGAVYILQPHFAVLFVEVDFDSSWAYL